MSLLSLLFFFIIIYLKEPAYLPYAAIVTTPVGIRILPIFGLNPGHAAEILVIVMENP